MENSMPDKTNPSHSNPPITLDLRSLLALPHETFLPSAFAALMGREPDVVGLTHYALRLQRGANRVLILAEMRTSPEGRRHAPYANSDELELLVRRYQKIRSLPLGRWRWNLLPQFGREPPSDNFDWERWATNYEGRKIQAAAAISPVLKTTDGQSMQHDSRETSFAALEQRVEALSVALQQVLALMQTQGTPAQPLPVPQTWDVPPREASWAARSVYAQLLQKTTTTH
jgi:hypothetical protein